MSPIELVSVETAGEQPSGAQLPPEEESQRVVRRSPTNIYPSRVSFAVNDNGTLNVAGLRDKTRSALKQAFSSGEAKQVLGMDASEVQVFRPEETGLLYEALSRIEIMFFTSRFGGRIPLDIAQESFGYSDNEKRLLAEPTAAVLNKHLGERVGKYKEELQLVMLLMVITKQKWDQARTLVQERLQRETELRQSGRPEPVFETVGA